MSLRRNIIANYLGQGLVALLGFVFIPVYIKYLGIEAFGLIGIFALMQTWLNLLDMGMSPTLGREMARFTGGSCSNESIRDLLRSIEIIAMVVAIVITSGVAFSASWLANSWVKSELLSPSVLEQSFVIMGGVIALHFIEGVYRSAIVGLQRQVLYNLVNGVMITIRAFGAIAILHWLSPTITAFFLWQGAISLITVLILNATTYSILPKAMRRANFSLTALQEVWYFAGGMIGITFMALLLTQIDKLLLSKLLPLRDFGYYTLAGTIASVIYMIMTPITQAFYPKFCEQYTQNNQKLLAESFHKSSQLVSVLVGSTAIVLIFFSETFLRLWTQDFELSNKVSLLLSLLVLGTLLNGLTWIPFHLQLAHGWLSFALYVTTLAVLIIVPMIFWVVPRYGAVGTAWTWVMLNIGYFFIWVQFMCKRILTEEKWQWYFEDVFSPLLTTTISVGLIKVIFPNPETSIGQFLLLLFAAIVALTTSTIFAHHLRYQLLLKIKQLFSKT